MTPEQQIQILAAALNASVMHMQIDTKSYVLNGVTEELALRVDQTYVDRINKIREGLDLAKRVQP